MTAEVSDAALATGFLRDPELFSAVYHRYFHEIYRYVAGRLDTQVAEDVTAEVFVTAFGQRDRFDAERGGLRPWLFGIATNLVARHRRKEARHYKALQCTAAEPTAEGHENRVVTWVSAGRMRPQLLKALAGLSTGERDVVLLVALGQLSYEEVAQALGLSSGTVGSRLSRARKKLHNAIDQEEFNG